MKRRWLKNENYKCTCCVIQIDITYVQEFGMKYFILMFSFDTGGSIAGVALICIAVIMAMYCYCKKNRSRGPYVAVPGNKHIDI